MLPSHAACRLERALVSALWSSLAWRYVTRARSRASLRAWWKRRNTAVPPSVLDSIRKLAAGEWANRASCCGGHASGTEGLHGCPPEI